MNQHFANLGDVWKHLVLAELLRLHPPKHYWETHAGSVSYSLTESATRNHGAVRFLAQAPSDSDLRNTTYLNVLRSMPGSYPGSPLLAISILGNRANYVLCDLDPQSVASLRHATGDLHASVMQADGMVTLKALAERENVEPEHVMVHIDPFRAARAAFARCAKRDRIGRMVGESRVQAFLLVRVRQHQRTGMGTARLAPPRARKTVLVRRCAAAGAVCVS